MTSDPRIRLNLSVAMGLVLIIWIHLFVLEEEDGEGPSVVRFWERLREDFLFGRIVMSATRLGNGR